MVRKKWTEEDINFIKKNYGVIPLKQMAEKLNTTASSVQHKAIREGVKVPRAWTKEELEFYCILDSESIKKHIKEVLK